MLTTLDIARRLSSRPDLISAIRIRVAGVTGVDPQSRERVRLAAEEIAARTGLAVDIAVGSSPQPQQVLLAGGEHGRPQLLLREGWSKKGVAVAIVEAADRKSLVLFGLILVVCVLFLINAVTAAVRDRRRELAILACLGWTGRRRAALILTEVGQIGVMAGLLSAAVTFPLALLTNVSVGWQQVAFAGPVAVALTMLAGLGPAWQASRAHPAGALHPAVPAGRRQAKAGGITGLALANVRRAWGRSATASLSIAVGVAAMVVLAATLWAFDGAVVGTLLGDAVSVKARDVDVIAVIGTVLLGGLGLADVLYLNIRERGNELATLLATGWTDANLTRLIVNEGLAIGFVGTGFGAILGVAGIGLFAGDLPARLWATAGAIVAVGIALTLLFSLLPTLMLRRLPMASLLAEE